jgi:hypothetical protein
MQLEFQRAEGKHTVVTEGMKEEKKEGRTTGSEE